MIENIGVVGVGAIAEAIVGGLAAALPDARIHLSPRNAATATRLAAEHETVSVCEDNQAVVDRSDVLLLCVRPADVEAVLDEIHVPHDRTIVSAVAGWSIEALVHRMPHGPEVARVIPLPAVRELRGTTAAFPTHPVVDEVFGPLGGTVIATDEAQLDAMSAATATVSAHLTYLATITRWLSDQGLPASDAESFLRGIFAEVGVSLTEQTAPLDDLVRAHETPAGLNEALRTGWFDEDNQTRLLQALDRNLARVTSPR